MAKRFSVLSAQLDWAVPEPAPHLTYTGRTMVQLKLMRPLTLGLSSLLLPFSLVAQGIVWLPATGQMQSYAPGDDGDLRKGVSWPTPRFFDKGDGTVIDLLTGRIWLKNGNCAQAEVAWQEALDYVTELNTSGTMNNHNCADMSYGGTHQTDWRLPNVLELESLLNLDRPNMAAWLNTQGFVNVPSNVGGFRERYWSSTTYQTDVGDDREHAWTVQVTEGRVRHEDKVQTNRFTWAVRGGR